MPGSLMTRCSMLWRQVAIRCSSSPQLSGSVGGRCSRISRYIALNASQGNGSVGGSSSPRSRSNAVADIDRIDLLLELAHRHRAAELRRLRVQELRNRTRSLHMLRDEEQVVLLDIQRHMELGVCDVQV